MKTKQQQMRILIATGLVNAADDLCDLAANPGVDDFSEYALSVIVADIFRQGDDEIPGCGYLSQDSNDRIFTRLDLRPVLIGILAEIAKEDRTLWGVVDQILTP